MEIEVSGVKITLTKDQLAEIAKQQKRVKSSSDIHSYPDACEVLGRTPKTREDFNSDTEWFTHRLFTKIEAANFLDNDGKKWEADFTNNSSKFIPYFERKSSGWVVDAVNEYSHRSFCPVALYFKVRKTAEMFAERFLPTYNKYLG